MQKYVDVDLVDRVKSFPNILIPTSIHLQTSASIQPRTSLSKFGRNSINFFIRLLHTNSKDRYTLRDPLLLEKYDSLFFVPLIHVKFSLTTNMPQQWLDSSRCHSRAAAIAKMPSG